MAAITFSLGPAKLPGIASDDIGRCAPGIFRRLKEYIGERVGVAGDHLSGEEMAAAFTRWLNPPVWYHDVLPEVFRRLPFPRAAELANMFQLFPNCSDELFAARSVKHSRELNPALEGLEDWRERNHRRIPLA